MRKGWDVKTLGEVIVKSGTIDPRKTPTKQFQYVDVSSVSRKSNKIEEVATLFGADAPSRARRLIKSGDVIFATIRPTLQRITQVPECLDGQVCSTGYFVFRTKPEVEPRYLYYYLFSAGFMDEMEALQSGASYPAVNDSQVKSRTIPLPPLDEQGRIVAVLDEAFEGIDLALTAATKNLASAQELFETTLNTTFTQKGEGWVETTLGEVCSIAAKLVDPKESEYLDLPHLGAGNMISNTGEIVKVKTAREEGLISGKFVFDPDTVLYSKIRPYLKKACRPSFIGLCSADVYPLSVMSGVILKDYLYHLLMSANFTEYAISGSSRAGMPKVNRNHLFAYKFWMPDVSIQQSFVSRLDHLKTQTQRLEALYQQKIDMLTELKQSLVQKAFAGELTASETEHAVDTVDTKSPEFGANVIAYNFKKHEEAQQDRTYGRVKAQKGLHLVEAIGGVDLGRESEKNAAGPNDSAHARSAEGWAKTNQFFEFVKRTNGPGYDFVKLSNYSKLLAQAEVKLAAFSDRIDKAISPLVHKRTQPAEVFTTVHTAWNNLLIDGVDITDKAIVREAREDWHPDKMKIARNKFFEAIADIRQRGLEPTGTGKRVGEKPGGLF